MSERDNAHDETQLIEKKLNKYAGQILIVQHECGMMETQLPVRY